LWLVLTFSALGVISTAIIAAFAVGFTPLLLLAPFLTLLILSGAMIAVRRDPEAHRPFVQPALTYKPFISPPDGRRKKIHAVTVDQEREVYGIYATLHTLPTSLGLPDTLNLVSDRLLHLVPGATAVIYLAIGDEQPAVVVASEGPDSDSFPIGSDTSAANPAESAMRHLQTAVGLIEIDGGSPFSDDRSRSSAAVPLVHEGNAFGAIMLVGELSRESFEHLESVTLFAAGGLYTALTHQRARESALTDPYMRMPNFRAAINILDQRIGASIRFRNGEPIAVICARFDIEGMANDDLTAICSLVQSELRHMDILARGEQNELLIVLPRANSTEAQLVADRLKRALDEHLDREGQVCPYALGIASFPVDADTGQDLIGAAQENLRFSGPIAIPHPRAELARSFPLSR
jgi:GGDEF domain-containing protein